MKYSAIEIYPTEKSWKILNYSLDGEREPKKEYKPAPNGIFYYPSEWDVEKAFNILKVDIIERHKSRIENLTESMQKLSKLEFRV